MIAACIGVFASFVAVALGVTSMLRTEGSGADIARLLVAALALLPVLLLLVWGTWELVDAALSIGSISAAPVHYVFWLVMALTDFSLGVALLANAMLLFVSRVSPARKESLLAWRRRSAPVVIVLGVTELVTSVLFALF